MPIHELKCHVEYFEPIYLGTKNFEVRLNDRNFQVKDLLWLREYNPTTQSYTDRDIVKTVTYILHGGKFGIDENYVVMGLGHQKSANADFFIEYFLKDNPELDKEKLFNGCREAQYVRLRQKVSTLLRLTTKKSLSQISSVWNQGHCSALHSFKDVRNAYDTDKKFRAHWDKVLEDFKVSHEKFMEWKDQSVREYVKD